MPRSRVHTYHCAFCSHLLLASTHQFSALPTRQPPGLDGATIVPLPPPPPPPAPLKRASSPSPSSSSDDEDAVNDKEDEEQVGDNKEKPNQKKKTKTTKNGSNNHNMGKKEGYTLLLTLLRDRAPNIVTREDGFEKRIVWRCGRCRVIVAYQVDNDMKERGRFLYVLPGGVVESQELGKDSPSASGSGSGVVMGVGK
jgi:hypothetical protein